MYWNSKYISKFMATINSVSLLYAVPPDIIDKKSSGDLIVLEGDDVTLECRAKGHPQPTIIWRREDSQEIVVDNDKAGKVFYFFINI